MKTYLLDLPNKLKRFDNSLDFKTALCNKAWVVFDDTQSKQRFIFKEDGGLIRTSNGIGNETSWEYLPTVGMIKLNDQDGGVVLYHPTILEEKILILNIDGTTECSFLYNESFFVPRSLDDIIKRIKTNPLSTPLPISPDKRKIICFAGEIFSQEKLNGEFFYVSQDKKYAFSKVIEVLPNALLVRAKDGDYIFYYNDSLDNNYCFTEKPTMCSFRNGLVLEALILDDIFFFHNEVWYKIDDKIEERIKQNDFELYSYIKIEGEDGIPLFFKYNSKEIAPITEETFNAVKTEIEKKQSGPDRTFIIIILIIFVVLILLFALISSMRE